jgi:DNA (cytosine-5)-methyltransferase 1
MRLLDLFCGAGGAAMGYFQAGFADILGIDISPQPRYPFKFIQADALNPPVNLRDFDLIHASPPCQRFMRARSFNQSRHSIDWLDYPDLLTPCREILISSGVPYVIENVPGTPTRNLL